MSRTRIIRNPQLHGLLRMREIVQFSASQVVPALIEHYERDLARVVDFAKANGLSEIELAKQKARTDGEG